MTLDDLISGADPAVGRTFTGGTVPKKIQNWYFWIVADVVYVPLYGVKHVWLTGLVYRVFLIPCFRGIAEWRQALVQQRPRLGRLGVPAFEGTE